MIVRLIGLRKVFIELGFSGKNTLCQKYQMFLGWFARAKDKPAIIFLKIFALNRVNPNKITSLRLILALLIFYTIIFHDYRQNSFIIFCLILGGFSDYLDGASARYQKRQSEFGSWMDKVIDKIFLVPLGVAEFWNFDRLLTIISIIGVIISTWSVTKNYLENNKIPSNGFNKFGMFVYNFGICIAIWPSWQIFGWALLWLGVVSGALGLLLNAKRAGIFRVKTNF